VATHLTSRFSGPKLALLASGAGRDRPLDPYGLVPSGLPMRPGVAPRSPPAPSRAQREQLLGRSVERRSIPPGQAAHRHPKERGHLGQRYSSGFAKSSEDRHPLHVGRAYAGAGA
jgi:hypothetical protein